MERDLSMTILTLRLHEFPNKANSKTLPLRSATVGLLRRVSQWHEADHLHLSINLVGYPGVQRKQRDTSLDRLRQPKCCAKFVSIRA